MYINNLNSTDSDRISQKRVFRMHAHLRFRPHEISDI